MSEVKRYAHLEDDLVTNVSLWDGVSDWNPGCEIVELADDSPVGPGWTRNKGKWIEPPLTEEQIAMLAAIEALNQKK
jgi:hypothetical protein